MELAQTNRQKQKTTGNKKQQESELLKAYA